MIVFKEVDQYDRNTGKKIGSKKVFDFQICDFTGERIKEYSNPNIYIIDYNDNDPCAGDGEGERWLYEWEKKENDEREYH